MTKELDHLWLVFRVLVTVQNHLVGTVTKRCGADGMVFHGFGLLRGIAGVVQSGEFLVGSGRYRFAFRDIGIREPGGPEHISVAVGRAPQSIGDRIVGLSAILSGDPLVRSGPHDW